MLELRAFSHCISNGNGKVLVWANISPRRGQHSSCLWSLLRRKELLKMFTQTSVNSETSGRMSDALQTAGKIAEVGVDFRQLRKRLENAVEDAVLEAERMAKHG